MSDPEIPVIEAITDTDGLPDITDIHGEALTLGSRVAVDEDAERLEAVVEAMTERGDRFWVLRYTQKSRGGVIARYLRRHPQTALESIRAERLA